MEKMPFQPELAKAVTLTTPAMHTTVEAVSLLSPAVTTSDWRQRVPILASSRVTLRELRPEDAQSLFAMLSTEEVARFISPPPTTLDGFRRFIEWALRER